MLALGGIRTVEKATRDDRETAVGWVFEIRDGKVAAVRAYSVVRGGDGGVAQPSLTPAGWRGDARLVAERQGSGGPSGLQNRQGVATPRLDGSIPSPLRARVSASKAGSRPHRTRFAIEPLAPLSPAVTRSQGETISPRFPHEAAS